jgi:hypothetical protein
VAHDQRAELHFYQPPMQFALGLTRAEEEPVRRTTKRSCSPEKRVKCAQPAVADEMQLK